MYISGKNYLNLNLTRPIGLPPHAPVAQKIADQRLLIANSAKVPISDVRFKKTRLLHLGNVEKPPLLQFFAQWPPEGQISSFLLQKWPSLFSAMVQPPYRILCRLAMNSDSN